MAEYKLPNPSSLTGQVLEELKKHPSGIRSGELQKSMKGINVYAPLQALTDHGIVRRDGAVGSIGGRLYTVLSEAERTAAKKPRSHKKKAVKPLAKKPVKATKAKKKMVFESAKPPGGVSITLSIPLPGREPLVLTVDEALALFEQLRGIAQ